MPIVGRLQEFNLSKGNWNSYCDRLKMYFRANKIQANLYLETLMTCVGDETYELITNLTTPRPVLSYTFEEIIKLVGDYLQPKTSVVLERYKFRQRLQGANETVMRYHTALKKLARNCDFGSALQENLRDQLVCGLRSESMRKELFLKTDLTYDDAVKIALGYEAACKENALIKKLQMMPSYIVKRSGSRASSCSDDGARRRRIRQGRKKNTPIWKGDKRRKQKSIDSSSKQPEPGLIGTINLQIPEVNMEKTTRGPTWKQRKVK